MKRLLDAAGNRKMVETDIERTIMLADFGVCAQLRRSGRGRKTVKGIFDAQYTEIDVGGTIGFQSTTPRFVCKTSDLRDTQDADSLTIDGDVYLIRVMQPDGTGMTEIQLEKQ